MDIHTITIPDEHGGGWVEIKARRGFGAAKRISTAGISVSRNEETAAIDAWAKALAVLESSVLSWSLPLPAKREGFEDLDEDLGDFIIDAIEDYYESRKRPVEEAKTDAAPSTDS